MTHHHRRRPVKRFAPPGTSPGTLLPPSADAAGPARLSLVVYDAGSATVHAIGSVADALPLLAGASNAWLSNTSHHSAALKELETHFGVHPLVLEDIVNIGQRPKVEQSEKYAFVVVDIVRGNGNGDAEEEQVSLLLFDTLLVSIQEHESELFRPVEERLLQGRGKMRSLGVDYLAYAVIDAMVDTFFPQLEAVGEAIDEVEDQLLERPGREAFERLHILKRKLLRLRRATWPLREAVGALGRADTPLVREGTRVFLRDVYDHTVQIIDIIETFRDMAAELVDLYLSSMSNRLNEIMKVLAIIATIFMPLSFLAAVYGMNFNPQAGPLSMPELNWRWGYPLFWATILASAGSMLLWFKKRDWF